MGSASWSGDVITISGTPSTSVRNYTIPLSGGCGSVNATGTITVTADNTAGAASSTPTLCINTALTNITHATTGTTGISNDGVAGANGLPGGVSASWSGMYYDIGYTMLRYIQLHDTIVRWMWKRNHGYISNDNTAGVASSTPTLCKHSINKYHACYRATGISNGCSRCKWITRWSKCLLVRRCDYDIGHTIGIGHIQLHDTIVRWMWKRKCNGNDNGNSR